MVNFNSMPAIRYLLLLRVRICWRFVKELGWIRTLLFCSLLIMGLIQILEEQKSAISLLILGGTIISGIHFKRKDQYFIQSLGIPEYRLYFVEYLLLSLPLLILLTYIGAWFWMLLLITACSIISLLPATYKKVSNPKTRMHFPLSLPYEWASGLRDQKWMLSVLLISGLTLIWVYLFVGWIFVFFITAVVGIFYTHCEPAQLILLTGKTAAAFISKKLLIGLHNYIVLSGILWAEMMVRYPEYILYSLLFLGANLLLLATVIVGKYAFYRENMNIEMMTSIIFGIGCICLVVPYLSPVLVLLFFWLLMRGYKRLKWEVYAFHE